MEIGQQLKRALVPDGQAETWVSGYHLTVNIQSPNGSNTGGPQVVVSALNKKFLTPIPVQQGILALEMKLEEVLDYHRGSAIWWSKGTVVLIDACQRSQIQVLLTKGVAAETGVKNTLLREVGVLLGIALPPFRANEHVYANGMSS